MHPRGAEFFCNIASTSTPRDRCTLQSALTVAQQQGLCSRYIFLISPPPPLLFLSLKIRGVQDHFKPQMKNVVSLHISILSNI